MSWVSDAREQQERVERESERRRCLIEELGAVFFDTLSFTVQVDVQDINNKYSHIFNRQSGSLLEFRGGSAWSFEVTCGPNTTLRVEQMSGDLGIKATRRIPTGKYGEANYVKDPYFYQIDYQECLRLEDSKGRHVACEHMSKELLAFLIS